VSLVTGIFVYTDLLSLLGGAGNFFNILSAGEQHEIHSENE
jgi:hypothetical protein